MMAAVVGATDADRLVAVDVRRCPDLFSLAVRQVLQAQVRYRTRTHYCPDADEKRAAREECVGRRLHLGYLSVRPHYRPASGGSHALDDSDRAGHETADAFADHVRDQIYVRIPGQRWYEQNRTSAPDQRHGERKHTEHDAVHLAKHETRHVIEPGQQEHGRHAGSEHGDRQLSVVPIAVFPTPGTIQQRAHVSGLYGNRQV